MNRARKFNKRRGQTLIETVLALAFTVILCTAALSTFLVGTSSWVRGQTRIDVELPSQQSVRQMASILRGAMAVSVDANGQGLSYRLPAFDSNGNILAPATWDGINRRMELDGSALVLKADNAANQTICSNVITTDPLSSTNAAYQIFTASPGSITRSLTIMLVSQQTSSTSTKPLFGRHRETIFLRNVPQLSQ